MPDTVLQTHALTFRTDELQVIESALICYEKEKFGSADDNTQRWFIQRLRARINATLKDMDNAGKAP